MKLFTMLFDFDTGLSILLRVNRHSGYGNLEKRLVTLTCIFYLQRSGNAHKSETEDSLISNGYMKN